MDTYGLHRLATEIVSALGHRASIHTLRTLTYVGINPGRSIADIAEGTGRNAVDVLRDVQRLSTGRTDAEIKGKTKHGIGLVTVEWAPNHGRKRMVYLSRRGQEILNQWCSSVRSE